ncbi:polyprenol monophosphomannose synthase [Corynebacterium sp. CNCTC7651]|uniref:polyprenol monophosphomannose synthase n=1 Tax=Corynebacterium sp. CNCTC7651 TaxID=2815361 RepID=UPI001F2A1257|nr:polyprenol monophosphomannose synthase [Corynebacterium sp. CNCTC7651]UIZ93134.1 polyprenol monophosphomannose synthase [Corynebacterium sp. CNCTC7651]
MSTTTLVIIPTYNEVENLPLIVDRVLNANPDVDVLVVDDNSPDGTGEKADELAAAHDRVNVLHRRGKEGLLAAYRAGFTWGLERDYEVLVQMDADGSHAPEELSLLLDEISNGADLVIGSRYVEGGEVKNWPKQRYLLSKVGNRYISLMLGGEVKDMTAGYRAIRREVLEELDLAALSPKGYIFQAELAHKAIDAGFDVREVPVTFEDRKLGDSKLDASFAVASLGEVTKWGITDTARDASELVKEMTALAQYEINRAKLPNIGEVVTSAAETAGNTAVAMKDLAAYELKRTSLSEIPGKAKHLVEDAANTAASMVELAGFELRRAGLLGDGKRDTK